MLSPADEELKEDKDNDLLQKCQVEYKRLDRFGNSIYLKKHLKLNPTLKRIHKLTFVDQVNIQVKNFEAHPNTLAIKEYPGHADGKVLVNPNLKIK